MKEHNVGFHFQPFSVKQKKMLTWWMPGSPYEDYNTVLASGSIRSGKTISCIDSFFTFTLSRFSGENFILAGKSIGALKRNVITPALQILTTKGISYKYIRSGPDCRLVVGMNNYYMFGANNEASQDTLQGLTAAGCYGDEIALFPQSFVNQMVGRCSVTGSKNFFNCNPEGPYNFVKTDYIDKANAKRILVLNFNLDDNLTLSEEKKSDYRNWFDGIFYKRNILGLWVLAEGIIYAGFSEEIHCITEKQVPKTYDYVYFSCDHGITNPFAALKAKTKMIDGRPHIYIVDELYDTSPGRTDPILFDKYNEFVNGASGYHIPDPEAAGFVNMLRKPYAIKRANKAVSQGISTVATFFSENRVHIVKDNCPNLVKELESYRWNEKKSKLGFDEPVKENDHCVDCLRYLIYTLFPNKYIRVVACDGDTNKSRWRMQ